MRVGRKQTQLKLKIDRLIKLSIRISRNFDVGVA